MSSDSWGSVLAVIAVVSVVAYSCDKEKKDNDRLDAILSAAQSADSRAAAIEEKLNIY